MPSLRDVLRRPARRARALPEPDIDPAVADRPALADWAMRPVPWSTRMDPAAREAAPDGATLAPGTRLFHDDPAGAVAYAQRPAPDGPAPFALTLSAGAFSGSYLSLAIDLPEAAARTLWRGHVLRVSARVDAVPEARLHVRLNLRRGPNTDRLTERLAPGRDGTASVEFDLGFQAMAPGEAAAAWVDLSIDTPARASLTLADLTLARRPRAEL